MKKIGLGVLLLFLLLFAAAAGTGHADRAETHIYLDGHELAVAKDAGVQIMNGSVMVPLRLVAEQLGYAVKWDNTAKTASIRQGETTLKLKLNHAVAEVSGKEVPLEQPPTLNGSLTLVPLRFVGEATGAAVKWDNLTKTVYLTSPAKTSAQGTPAASSGKPAGAASGINGESNALAGLTGITFKDNKLQLALNGSVSPRVFAMTGNDRIVVDLPDTAFAADFTRNMANTESHDGQIAVIGNPDVSAVRYALFSSTPSAIRVVIDLNNPRAYTVTKGKEGSVTVELTGTSPVSPPVQTPAATPSPAAPTSIASAAPLASVPPGATATPGSSATPGASATPVPLATPTAPADGTSTMAPDGKTLVVIDAGHGGKDPGGISLGKQKEKDFTLATTLKIRELLKNDPNIELVLTRSDDRYPTLQERTKLANELKADLFISIHANSIPEGSLSNPSGTETYYTRPESLEFANIVHKHLAAASSLADRGVRQSSLHVTRETKMPAILLECGYLSNAKDEALLYSEDFQQQVAEAVVAGIKEYVLFHS
ncbi:hypothetical protein GCM10010912_21250 [Paenibacillus albidus]|uniref:MurNAc-LAA domain-containing protein n=1 Tax=Paenibacillus albidus TaxID=2041023 RepID=A0A917C988_9BACL|nr:N-acetylmuramoyl-L-alanine amidase family protein [Paenibacillus albidus]GGF75853.1 hypothetical protein GCM10010912_21250 [Paenibacillus albidus]